MYQAYYCFIRSPVLGGALRARSQRYCPEQQSCPLEGNNVRRLEKHKKNRPCPGHAYDDHSKNIDSQDIVEDSETYMTDHQCC